MSKSWQAYVTHEWLVLTPQEIKEDPEYYKPHFKDINNPTDKEVRKFFRWFLKNMSDDWELTKNGTFKIVKKE